MAGEVRRKQKGESAMSYKIVLQPGELNDANRDYLPKAIKGSRMVVNENGNNSQVYPARLTEHVEDILGDGIRDVWYEYVPESYDSGKKTPLVFSMHGGLMTGWGQCIYTSWSLVAEKEGFLCVFPNASANKMWMIECDDEKMDEITTREKLAGSGIPALNRPTGSVPEFHDVRLVMKLLERMREKYNIDETRVYIQGMSMGNAMTSQVARYMGAHFAAAAGSGCPTNCKLLFDSENRLINAGGPMDIWQSRLEHDKTPYHYGEDDKTVVQGNVNYWRRLNGALGLPEISIRGEKNLLLYRGDKANVMLMDVHNRDHGQTFDDAQMVWDYLFSGVSKTPDGTVRHAPTRRAFRADEHALALTEDAKQALLNGKPVPLGGKVFRRDKLKYHGLNGGQLVRGSYLYAPVTFLAKAFGGQALSDGDTAEVRLSDGRLLAFAHGCVGCTIDNTVEAMVCEAITMDGTLYVPAEWFCAALYDWHVSCYGDTLYAADHFARLSRYAAWMISDVLLEREGGQRGMV